MQFLINLKMTGSPDYQATEIKVPIENVYILTNEQIDKNKGIKEDTMSFEDAWFNKVGDSIEGKGMIDKIIKNTEKLIKIDMEIIQLCKKTDIFLKNIINTEQLSLERLTAYRLLINLNNLIQKQAEDDILLEEKSLLEFREGVYIFYVPKRIFNRNLKSLIKTQELQVKSLRQGLNIKN